MKILFKTSNHLPGKATVGHSNFREHYAAINQNTAWEVLLPTIKTITQEILIRYVSQELYDDLATRFEAGTALTPEQDLVLTMCQRVVALNTILHASSELNVGIGDMGIVEKGSANSPVMPVAQWRYKEFKYELTKKADKALDSLIAQLDKYVAAGVAYFDLYKNSEAYTVNRTSFFTSAKQFNAYVQINNSRRLFDELILDITTAEEDIDKVICEDQFNTLVQAIKDGDATDAQVELIEKIRRYVSAKAVSKCMPRLFLTLNTHGLSLSSYSDGIESHNHHAASFKGAEAVSAYIIRLSTDAEGYFRELVNFIYTNIDDYPLIKDSECYKAYTASDRIPICTGPGGVMF